MKPLETYPYSVINEPQIRLMGSAHNSIIKTPEIRSWYVELGDPLQWRYITGPLWGESTGRWWIPPWMANNAEGVSMPWRYHVVRGSSRAWANGNQLQQYTLVISLSLFPKNPWVHSLLHKTEICRQSMVLHPKGSKFRQTKLFGDAVIISSPRDIRCAKCLLWIYVLPMWASTATTAADGKWKYSETCL